MSTVSPLSSRPRAVQKQAEGVIQIKSIIACQFGVQFQTSFDSALPINAGSASGSLTAIGDTTIAISAGLGPMIRVVLAATGTTQAVLSIYYTPKAS